MESWWELLELVCFRSFFFFIKGCFLYWFACWVTLLQLCDVQIHRMRKKFNFFLMYCRGYPKFLPWFNACYLPFDAMPKSAWLRWWISCITGLYSLEWKSHEPFVNCSVCHTICFASNENYFSRICPRGYGEVPHVEHCISETERHCKKWCRILDVIFQFGSLNIVNFIRSFLKCLVIR